MNQSEASAISQASYTIIRFKWGELPIQYEAMLYSKFLRSLRYSNQFFNLIQPNVYYDNYRIYLRTLLARPTAVIKLAVLSDDHDIVLGWALVEPQKLHYVYVNRENRRIGIATSLLSEPFSEFTHITKIGLILWPLKYPDATFNPF